MTFCGSGRSAIRVRLTRGRAQTTMATGDGDSRDPDEILTTPEMGRKLIVALRSVSSPAAEMQAVADRGDLALRRDLLTRIDAMDKATTLWHDDLVRVPTEVQKSIGALRDLLEQARLTSIAEVRGEMERMNGASGRERERISGEVKTLIQVSEERFSSIQTQFTAQKESAGETQKSSQAAIAKSEASTAEAIRALTATFNTVIASQDSKYDDLKERLVSLESRGTSRTEFSGTAIAVVTAIFIGAGAILAAISLIAFHH